LKIGQSMPNERDNAHAADRRTQDGAWKMWGGAKKKTAWLATLEIVGCIAQTRT
jgi:hypothetical protein